jgi:DNA-binding MarR family transcriptional regulator
VLKKMTRSTKNVAPEAYLEPMHSIGYLARVNFRMFSRALEQLTLPHGVSAGQWRFLRVLWEEDNITQRVLSNRTGTKEATTVHAVRSLISSGLIKRTRCTDDKRKLYITLTPRGRQLRAKLMPMVVEVNEIALAGIAPQDIAIARRVLSQTYTNLCNRLGASDD